MSEAESKEFGLASGRRPLTSRWLAVGVSAALLASAFAAVFAEETPPPALEAPAEQETEPPLPDPCPDQPDAATQTPADQELQARVQGAIDTAKLERLTKVEVAAIGKVVCLRGTAANPTDRKRAESIAGEVEGVGRVVNKLTIPLADLFPRPAPMTSSRG
jgi:hypothetical protein